MAVHDNTKMEGNTSLTLLFFKWWYGEAYGRLLKYIKAAYIYAFDLFSVKICLKTLFAPWKRDVISYEGLTIQQRFQVWTMNLASRFIGAIVKTLTVLAFLIFSLLISIFAILAVIIWLAYPIIIIYLIYSILSPVV